MRGSNGRLAATALLLLASACVSTGRGKEMEQRIARLEGENEAQIKALDEQRGLVRERIAQVDAKIAEVQKKIDELNQTAHRSGADIAVNQDKLADELTRLRGTLEEQAHRLAGIDRGLADLRSDTDARFAALKGAGALDQFEARKKLEAVPRPTDKSAYLSLAREHEAKGERPVARVLYEEFVKKWPTDPNAADAHFRLGELAYGEKRYREALLEYGKVAQDFPRSDKAPDALLRTAESMIAIDLRDDAKSILADIPKRYPGTTAATRAKARLAELAKGKAKAAPKKGAH